MGFALVHLAIYLSILLLCAIPLGTYIAKVLQGDYVKSRTYWNALEFKIAKICNIDLTEKMDWRRYLTVMLGVNLCGMLIVYLLQRLQYYLPLNPENLIGVAPDLAFNTAASFVTNTDWQAYAGENSLSYFTQTIALVVQQFLSAGTSIAIMAAFIRGLSNEENENLGNFWQDLMRIVLYILLPGSIFFAFILMSQGVIQNFKPYVQANLINPSVATAIQKIPMGPVASMVAIKQLGSNGGGFFNTNAAHPFENPNGITNYIELIGILLIPAALCYSFGIMVRDRRQGWALIFTMLLIFIPLAYISMRAEMLGNPLLNNSEILVNGNMEGKEVRFGPLRSALWGAATTATSNGSINSMHDSAMPISGLVYLILMQMGEIIFGGVGSGIYGMVLTVIITVFIAGLMVGRTPEYLGKKIEPYEMKIVCLVTIVMPLLALLYSGFASVTNVGLNSLANKGAHGLTEILYTFTSMKSNNGSAFAGLNANTFFYNVGGGILILISRFWVIIGVLALAGSLAKKKFVPVNAGTLATHEIPFIILLAGIIIIVCTLSFFPALALGPIVEHSMLWSK